MSGQWNDYLALLDEAAGLAEREAKRVAEADSVYNSEARRLQNELALAEREFKALKERNTRLQVSVRDLARSLGVTVPATSDLQRLTAAQLSSSMKSAEYDLDQIGKSLAYLKNQRQAIVQTPVQSPPQIQYAEPSQTMGDGPKGSFPIFGVLAGAGVGMILVIVLVVKLL